MNIATIQGIPLYDGDVEARDGIPSTVVALKDQIAATDGLLLVTPEYNNAMPGVFKNAIDWLSRPPADIARRIRHHPGPEFLATGAANAGHAALVQWPPDGVAGGECI